MFIGCDVNALIDGTKGIFRANKLHEKNQQGKKLMEIGKGHFLYSSRQTMYDVVLMLNGVGWN